MSILPVLHAYFSEHEWPVQEIEGQPLLRTGFEGKSGNFTCWAQAREDFHQALIYVVCPIKCPGEQLPLMAEFLMRANFGMLIGNFEMDYEDGEIRYKASIDVENSGLTTALFHNMVVAAVNTMDRYVPGALAVMHGGLSPVEAILHVESGTPAGEA